MKVVKNRNRMIAIALFTICLFSISTFGQDLVPMQQYVLLKVKLQAPVEAYPFPLRDVTLLESKFKHTMERDEKFLFNLEPDRLLSGFRSNAGLEPKAEKYGGWESGGLAGHSLGHYLSALSLLYGSTRDVEVLNRINYTVSELKEIQNARKTGYLGAIPNEDKLWDEVKKGIIETGNFSLNGYWSPWYTVHKIMAGLLDAYNQTGNKDALAIQVRFSDWAVELLDHLNENQMQNMLRCEYGGMTEVLVNTYALTGSKKYLDLSYRFYDSPVLDPLANHQDKLNGFHANTIIPKAIGSIRRYEITKDKNDLEIGKFFWETVAKNHTYAIGGNSYYEYFQEPGKLNDKLADNTTETCNTYNMLKLTQHLFGLKPSAKWMDFYEKALYNHILASQNPETGMTTYYVSLRMGGKKQFGDYQHSFTCCMGTGMENHVKYNENIYYKGGDGSLYVNLFIPSALNWEEKGIQIIQNANIPENNNIVLTITGKKPGKFTIRIRKPYWVKQSEIRINGKKINEFIGEDGYWAVERNWRNGDKISVYLPSDLHYEAMPDNPDRRAIFYGPIILAGNFGTVPLDPAQNIPVFVTPEKDANQWLRQENGLVFTSIGNTYPENVELRPFNEMVTEHYTVYWDFFTPNQWTVQQKVYEQERLKQQDIEARTISLFRPGEMQPERDHNLKGEKMHTGESNTRKWRAAEPGGFLSFDMDVDPEKRNILTMTYWGQDNRNSTFNILVNDTVIATEDINKYKENRFYEIDYKIPVELTKGKRKITIILKEAKNNNNIGPFYLARIAREK